MSSLFTRIIIKENTHKILKKNVPNVTKKMDNIDKNNLTKLCKQNVKRVDWTTSKEKRLDFKKSWV